MLLQRFLEAVQQQTIEFFGLVRISGYFISAIQHYNYRVFIQFSADGHYGWGILGYSIGFQKSINRPMARLHVVVPSDSQ